MADNTIDSLALEISASSRGAERALDRLADSLLHLQGSMRAVSNMNFSGFKSAMKSMRDSMTGFSGVGNLEKGISQIQRIARLNAEGLLTVAIGLGEESTALKGMSGISIPDLSGLEPLITNIRKFGGKNIGVATQNLPIISRDLVNFVSELNRVGGINFDFTGLQSLVQSISNLGLTKAVNATKNMKTLKEQLLRFISGLNGIGKLNFDVAGLNELVTALSKLGYSAALKAPANIKELADSLKYLLTTLSKAPAVSANVIQMTQSLAQLAAAGGKAGTASRALNSSFNVLPASTTKAKKGFSGLAGAIGKFYATYWLLFRAMSGFRKAINISSDLTEVQNVVDVTFGKMADTMNDFADSALKNYGMSELMAKKIASRFQSMGVAMGFTQDKMTEMSIELTKLTGDMASFYNESQESVAKALQSIFTGETEPLRRFGLDLSFATIEAWALAQGLDADMRSMTQAEKTMLRYQYVLANTGAASGDFLRTINSWHNQLVLLAGGFQQLGSIVGGVLINAFKPFIQALNSVMGAIINFAQVVSDALGAIFGWEYQTGGGVSQDLEAGAGAAGEIEDATGGAADNAKKLNKYIAAWHEVNNMTSNDGSGSGGGGGGAGGAGGAGAADGGQWVQTESLWEKYTSDIDSLYKLGEYIGKTLTDALNSIDWDSVYESARGFGSGLAFFLNGLISPELFGATGQTIAGALNTAIYAALSFGETFDWTNFGESIAAGVNNFFATFDFASLANTIDVWVQGIWTTITTAITNIDWKNVWSGAKEFLSNIDLETIAIIVGTVSIKNIGKVLISANILGIIQKAIGEKISSAIIKGISFAGIGKFLSSVFPSSVIIQTITTTMAETGASLPSVLLGAIITPIKTFFAVTLPGMITSGLSGLGSLISGGITALASALSVSVTAAGGIVVAAVVGVVAAIVAAVTHWDEIKAFFTETIPGWWNGTALPFFQKIPENLSKVWESVKQIASEKWGQFLDFMRGIPEKVREIITSIGEWFGQLPEKIGYALGYALGTVTKWGVDVYEYLKKKIPEIVDNVKTWFSEMPGKIYTAISTFFGDIAEWGENVYSNFKEKVDHTIQNVVEWFSEMPGKIYDTIIKIEGKISEWATNAISFFQTEVPRIVDKVIEFFGSLPEKIVTVGEDLIKGLWNGINNMVDWLGSNISGFVNGVIDGFKEGFDEHSPSKIAFEIGDFWTIGLGNGMIGGFDDIYRQIDGFTSKVAATQIPMPKLNTYVPKPDFTPGSYSMDKLRTTMQMEMDAKMAEYSYGIRQQNELLREQNELLRGIYEKPALSDDDVFNSTRRGQHNFQRRTYRTGWAGID